MNSDDQFGEERRRLYHRERELRAELDDATTRLARPLQECSAVIQHARSLAPLLAVVAVAGCGIALGVQLRRGNVRPVRTLMMVVDLCRYLAVASDVIAPFERHDRADRPTAARAGAHDWH